LKTIRFFVMAGQKREARLRAGCPGHPRLSCLREEDVDARHKAGHDELNSETRFSYSTMKASRRDPNSIVGTASLPSDRRLTPNRLWAKFCLGGYDLPVAPFAER
jgi:hypothetical protein